MKWSGTLSGTVRPVRGLAPTSRARALADRVLRLGRAGGGALGLLTCLSVPAGVHAQATATVTGVVRDADVGGPVAGVRVEFVGTGRGALGNAAGAFRIADVPLGEQTLRLQRLGYHTLELSIEVTAAHGPLDLRLVPDAVALEGITVRGDARADLVGVVIDAHSDEALPLAELNLMDSGLQPVGRRQAADLEGGFRMGDVQVGMYFLLVERLGYESQYLPLLHGVPAEPVEVRLTPDSAMLRGLAIVSRDLELRRRGSPRTAVLVDELRLRTATVAGMRAFLDAYSTLTIVPCTDRDRHATACACGGR